MSGNESDGEWGGLLYTQNSHTGPFMSPSPLNDGINPEAADDDDLYDLVERGMLQQVGRQLRKDFQGKAVPDFFKNGIWRFMQLSGVAIEGGVLTLVVGASYSTALAVLGTVFAYDMALTAHKIKSTAGLSVGQAFARIKRKKYYMLSIEKALKSYAHVIGYTACTGVVTQFLPLDGVAKVVIRSAAAGAGNAAITLTMDTVNTLVNKCLRGWTPDDHKGNATESIKDFFQYATMSLICDLSVAAKISSAANLSKISGIAAKFAQGGVNLLDSFVVATATTASSMLTYAGRYLIGNSGQRTSGQRNGCCGGGGSCCSPRSSRVNTELTMSVFNDDDSDIENQKAGDLDRSFFPLESSIQNTSV